MHPFVYCSPLYDLFEEELCHENGLIQVPDGAGIVLTIDEGKLETQTEFSYTHE